MASALPGHTTGPSRRSARTCGNPGGSGLRGSATRHTPSSRTCKACRVCPSRRPPAAAAPAAAAPAAATARSRFRRASAIAARRSPIGRPSVAGVDPQSRAKAACRSAAGGGAVAPVTCWQDCPPRPPESLTAASGGSLTVEPSRASCVDPGASCCVDPAAKAKRRRQARTRYAGESLSVATPSRAPILPSRATASAGGQPNSARFAAAENKSRCRSPVPAPSRMKSSVERFNVGEPLPAARRAAFASPSLATRATAACQSAAAVSLVFVDGRARRTGPASPLVRGSRSRGSPVSSSSVKPALVQAGLRVPTSSGARKARTQIIDPSVNRHGGQFGDVFGEASRHPVEVGRRCRRPKRRWASRRESPWSRKRTSSSSSASTLVPFDQERSASRRSVACGPAASRLRHRGQTRTRATSTAPSSRPSSRLPSRSRRSLRQTGKPIGRLPAALRPVGSQAAYPANAAAASTSRRDFATSRRRSESRKRKSEVVMFTPCRRSRRRGSGDGPTAACGARLRRRRIGRREGVGVRRVDPEHVERLHLVGLGAVIVVAKGELHPAADTRRQRPFQLFQRRHPELGKVAFRHRQSGRRQPNIMPELPALVVAFQAPGRRACSRPCPSSCW